MACTGSAPDQTESNSTAEPTVEMAPDTVAPVVDTTAPADPAPTPGEWTAGIVEKTQNVTGAALLLDARVAENEGFDRLVLEFEGDIMPSYHVEYIDRPIRQCGSGEEISVAGDGWLSVRLEPANAHTEEGQPTVQERSSMPGLPVVRQLTLICDFEAQVEWVLGVSSPNRYRVMELSEPARLIVDVRHE